LQKASNKCLNKNDEEIVYYYRPALRFTTFNSNNFEVPIVQLPMALDASIHLKIVSNSKLVACLRSRQERHHLCSGILLHKATFFVFPKSVFIKNELKEEDKWKQCYLDVGNFRDGFQIPLYGKAHELGENLMYCRVGNNINSRNLQSI